MKWFRFSLSLFVGAVVLAGGLAQAQDESNPPSFHHIHINAVDPANSIEFYRTMFGAPPVKFRGASDASLTDRSFILYTKVDEPAPSKMISALYHIGWGGVDGPSDFAWRDKKGMEWQTGLSTLGAEHYMYAYGPDREVVEVWTGFRHHRFGHVHLFSDDVGIATKWYVDNLGVTGPARVAPKPPKAPDDFSSTLDNPQQIFRYLWTSQVSTSNEVAINIFGTPSTKTVNWWTDPPIDEPLVKSDGRCIDHIAFSYRDIEPVLAHMKKNGVEIVEGIKERKEYNMKSFFVRGPDSALIEIVEARPLPEGVWE